MVEHGRTVGNSNAATLKRKSCNMHENFELLWCPGQRTHQRTLPSKNGAIWFDHVPFIFSYIGVAKMQSLSKSNMFRHRPVARNALVCGQSKWGKCCCLTTSSNTNIYEIRTNFGTWQRFRGTLDKTFLRVLYRFRVGPHRFRSDGNPMTLSRLFKYLCHHMPNLSNTTMRKSKIPSDCIDSKTGKTVIDRVSPALLQLRLDLMVCPSCWSGIPQTELSERFQKHLSNLALWVLCTEAVWCNFNASSVVEHVRFQLIWSYSRWRAIRKT